MGYDMPALGDWLPASQPELSDEEKRRQQLYQQVQQQQLGAIQQAPADTQNVQQQPAPITETPQQRLGRVLQQQPNSDDYKPSTFRKILGVLAGAVTQNANIGSGIINYKENRDRQDWQSKVKAAQIGAASDIANRGADVKAERADTYGQSVTNTGNYQQGRLKQGDERLTEKTAQRQQLSDQFNRNHALKQEAMKNGNQMKAQQLDLANRSLAERYAALDETKDFHTLSLQQQAANEGGRNTRAANPVSAKVNDNALKTQALNEFQNTHANDWKAIVKANANDPDKIKSALILNPNFSQIYLKLKNKGQMQPPPGLAQPDVVTPGISFDNPTQ